MNRKEIQKKEVDTNQRKRDQRPRQGRHEVRKKELKTEWYTFRKKGVVTTKIVVPIV